ncbi:MAG TPA: hypothetical protein PLJ90_03635, partial [Candidatus Cloacimonas sp.]|nr:hypothetical protein [Candidatus Cloacimonas sp.]
MKRHFFILFVLMGTILFAAERGLTVKEIEVSEEVTSISQPVPSLLQEESIMKTDTDSASKNWETLQELNLNFR